MPRLSGTINYVDLKGRYGFITLDDPSLTGGRNVFFHMSRGCVAVPMPGLYPSMELDRNILDPNLHEPAKGRNRVVVSGISWTDKGPRADRWCYEVSWKRAMDRILEDPSMRIPVNYVQAKIWGWNFVGIYGSHRAGDHDLFLNPTRKADLGFDDQGNKVPKGQYALWVLEFWSVPFATDIKEDAAFLVQNMGFMWAGSRYLFEGKFLLLPPRGWTRHQVSTLNSMLDFDVVTYFIDDLGLERAVVDDPAFADPFIVIHQTPRRHVCLDNCKPIPLPHERVEQVGSLK